MSVPNYSGCKCPAGNAIETLLEERFYLKRENEGKRIKEKPSAFAASSTLCCINSINQGRGGFNLPMWTTKVPLPLFQTSLNSRVGKTTNNFIRLFRLKAEGQWSVVRKYCSLPTVHCPLFFSCPPVNPPVQVEKKRRPPAETDNLFCHLMHLLLLSHFFIRKINTE